MFLYRTLFTSSVVLFYDLSVVAGLVRRYPFSFPFRPTVTGQSKWTVHRCISLFPISHVASCVAAVESYILGIRDVKSSIWSRAWRRVRTAIMLLALTRESSLHSPGAGMNPVSLVNVSDAFCLSRHVVKKYYCQFLSSVLRSSIALSLIHVGCL